MTEIVARISAYACMLLLGGCATYHALPLPAHANLADSVTDLRHVVPSVGSDTTSKIIAVDKPVNVNDVGMLAILNDPELESERGEFALAQADLTQSALIPNPSVSLSYAALLGGPGTVGAYTASLAQDIASLVTYRSRVAAARSHISQVNADLLWREWQVAQKARLLATDLYWNGKAIETSTVQLDSLLHTESQMVKAMKHGNVSLAMLSPIQASKVSLEQSVAALQLQQLKNWVALDALLGMKPGTRFNIAELSVFQLPPNLSALAASIQDRRPDLIALQLGYRSANENVRAAVLGQFPAFLLGGSWNSDTSQVRSGGPTVTFDLPIFSRNQGQVARTQATRLLLREQYQSRLDAATSNTLALQAQSHAIALRLASVEQQVGVAKTQAQAAKAAFKRGDLDARALTDFSATALSLRLRAFDLERARDETHIALELELGLGLPQVRIAPLDEIKPL